MTIKIDDSITEIESVVAFLKAIFRLAYRDLTNKNIKIRRQAIYWFFTPNKDFEYYCELLYFNSDDIRIEVANSVYREERK